MAGRGRSMKSPTTAIGTRIRAQRLECNMTAETLAKKVGCSRSYLSRVETGSVKHPGEKLLEGFATALEVDLQELIQLKPGAELERMTFPNAKNDLSGLDEVIRVMKSHLHDIEVTRCSMRSCEERLAKLAWTLQRDIGILEATREDG